MKNIILIGFMASGKTTIGERLSKEISFKFIDTDSEIERLQGDTIANIFEKKGEVYFRQLERGLLRDLTKKERVLVAAGGGAVMSFSAEELKTFDRVIFLHITKDEALRRLKDTDRPLLKNGDKAEIIDKLLAEREELYENAADLIVQTTGKTVDEVVGEIMELI